MKLVKVLLNGVEIKNVAYFRELNGVACFERRGSFGSAVVSAEPEDVTFVFNVDGKEVSWDVVHTKSVLEAEGFLVLVFGYYVLPTEPLLSLMDLVDLPKFGDDIQGDYVRCAYLTFLSNVFTPDLITIGISEQFLFINYVPLIKNVNVKSLKLNVSKEEFLRSYLKYMLFTGVGYNIVSVENKLRFSALLN